MTPEPAHRPLPLPLPRQGRGERGGKETPGALCGAVAESKENKGSQSYPSLACISSFLLVVYQNVTKNAPKEVCV